jgi:hypothetical protein
VLARDALTKCVVQLSGTLEGASGGDAGSVLKSAVVQLRKKIKKLDRLIAEALKGDTDRTDKLHFRVSGGIRQSRITVLLSSRARAGRAGRRFRRTFFDARR